MLSLFSLLSLALSVQAMAIKPTEVSNDLVKKSGPKVLKLDFGVHRSSANITKRDTPDEDLDNSRDIRYLMDMYLGSNKQKVEVDIDTGSSDLWVHNAKGGAAFGGAFNEDQSSTLQHLNKDFSIGYLDGSGVDGEFVKDTVTLEDGTSINNFQFAVTNGKDDLHRPPIFGIGRKGLESVSTQDQYDNFPLALVDAGIIEKPSYSIYMTGDGGDKGLVLFGGIDRAKYSGDLVTYPMSHPTRSLIKLNTVNFNGNTYDINHSVNMDTGTSWLILPEAVVNDLTSLFGASVKSNGDKYISCDQPTDKFVTFDFGDSQIQLSYADLVVRPFKGSCLLGVSAATTDSMLLGDVFLRKTYTYFDLEAGTVAIAPAIDTENTDIIQA